MGCSWELQAGPPAALGAFRANPSQWKSAGTILPSGSIALRLTYLGWQRPLSLWLGTQWEVIMVVPTTRANPEWMVGCSVVSPWTADLADLLTVPVSTYVARECTQPQCPWHGTKMQPRASSPTACLHGQNHPSCLCVSYYGRNGANIGQHCARGSHSILEIPRKPSCERQPRWYIRT